MNKDLEYLAVEIGRIESDNLYQAIESIKVKMIELCGHVARVEKRLRDDDDE